MANIKEIKTRIESVINTRQITNAMKMVSASKLRKAQKNIVQARPYANRLNEMIEMIKLKNTTTTHPLLAEVKKSGEEVVVVVTSDRGLCGAFNAHIIRTTNEYLTEHPHAKLICVGKKGCDYFKNHSDKIIGKYVDFFNEMNFGVSKEIASKVTELYLNEKYSKIVVIYNEFKSIIQQNIIAKQILPIIPQKSKNLSLIDFIYEPNEDIIIENLGKKYVNVSIWRILLESSAAEQGARMTAMESATENATELIHTLKLTYNRARQAAITKEIIEIASGANAIK
ncbi:MAG: ATP synthase F1 subunit gamma [Candidatus Cloacimonetes bacterium]|jgi:F-type H+-transporting ATPase subunit gamma|nr:ATP synthase F1 subunit gamma [Candidatus Cloacimonadota bacterium]MBT6994878.1 ATP synthase F1 subunit gamma [Candidatus Cloacimonadota bacterium]